NSVDSAVIARAFRIFIQPGAQAEIAKGPRELTFRAAIHIQARELSSKLRAHDRVANAVEIIFEMDEAAAQSDIAGEINSIRGKCARSIAPFLQSFAQRRQSVQSGRAPSEPGHRFDIAHAMLMHGATG